MSLEVFVGQVVEEFVGQVLGMATVSLGFYGIFWLFDRMGQQMVQARNAHFVRYAAPIGLSLDPEPVLGPADVGLFLSHWRGTPGAPVGRTATGWVGGRPVTLADVVAARARSKLPGGNRNRMPNPGALAVRVGGLPPVARGWYLVPVPELFGTQVDGAVSGQGVLRAHLPAWAGRAELFIERLPAGASAGAAPAEDWAQPWADELAEAEGRAARDRVVPQILEPHSSAALFAEGLGPALREALTSAMPKMGVERRGDSIIFYEKWETPGRLFGAAVARAVAACADFPPSPAEEADGAAAGPGPRADR